MSSFPGKQIDCLYCHQSAERPIGPEPDKKKAGKCPECAGPHHVWCWHVHGGCARPNCRFNPKTRNHSPIPYEPARIHELAGLQELAGIVRGPEKPDRQSNRWAAFEIFEKEYNTKSHRRIATAWNDELFNHFQPAEKYRKDVAVAKRCVQTLDRLVAEYRRQHWQAVVEIYGLWREHFDSCSDYLEGFQNHVEEALKQIALQYKERLQLALEHDDDEEVEKILREQAATYKSGILLDRFQLLTPEERNQITRALERLNTVRTILKYLEHVDTQQQALALYDEKLVELRLADSKTLTTQDRLALYEARRAQTRDALRHALVTGDDEQILAAAAAALAAGWTLRDETLDRVREAGERKAARERFAHADNERERLIAYDAELLSDDKQLPLDKRAAVQSTQRMLKPLLALKRAIKRNDVRTIAALVHDPVQAKELVPLLDPAEQDIVARTQEAIQAWHELRELLAIFPRTEETLKQIADLASRSAVARTLELLMTPYEKEQVRKAAVSLVAVDELHRLEQAPEMPYTKLAIAKTYHKAYEAEAFLPDTLNWSKIRTALEFEERWNTLTRALESGDERAIFAAWSPTQLHDALDLLTEREREILHKAIQNTGRRARLRSAFDSNDEQRIAYARGDIRSPTAI